MSVPVGARLRGFATQWQTLDDVWAHKAVLEGLRLDLCGVPVQSRVPREFRGTPEQMSLLDRAVSDMLKDRIIYPVPVSVARDGFTSGLFLVSKPDGGWRP